jgi:hypothetical protein
MQAHCQTKTGFTAGAIGSKLAVVIFIRYAQVTDVGVRWAQVIGVVVGGVGLINVCVTYVQRSLLLA